MRAVIGALTLGLSWLALMAGAAAATEATPDRPERAPGMLDATIAAACDNEPRSLAQVERAVAAGTAVPEPDAEDMPRGRAADRAVIAAVNEVEARFIACYNAADWPRLFGLLTDNAIRMVLDDRGMSAPDRFTAAGGPIAGGDPQQILVLLAIHDVRLLPDGRAAAIVWWGTAADPADVSEVNIHLLRQVEGRWLLDEEITP